MDDNIKIGEDFDIKLRMENMFKEKRTIKVVMSAKVSFYTGVVAKDLKETSQEVVLKPNRVKKKRSILSCTDASDSEPDGKNFNLFELSLLVSQSLGSLSLVFFALN